VIRVNLLPVEERVPEPKVSLKVPRARVWVTAVLAAAILVPIGGLYLMQQVKIAGLKADIQQAEVEHRRLKPQIDRINQLMLQREELNRSLAVIQTLTRERYVSVEVLDELSAIVPDYLWFTRIQEIRRGRVELDGMTFSNLMVAELMRRMEESDLFTGVTITISEKAKKSNAANAAGHPVLEFTLGAQINP
jgi:Tfp pilus assembly protein PilN